MLSFRGAGWPCHARGLAGGTGRQVRSASLRAASREAEPFGRQVVRIQEHMFGGTLVAVALMAVNRVCLGARGACTVSPVSR